MPRRSYKRPFIMASNRHQVSEGKNKNPAEAGFLLERIMHASLQSSSLLPSSLLPSLQLSLLSSFLLPCFCVAFGAVVIHHQTYMQILLSTIIFDRPNEANFIRSCSIIGSFVYENLFHTLCTDLLLLSRIQKTNTMIFCNKTVDNFFVLISYKKFLPLLRTHHHYLLFERNVCFFFNDIFHLSCE